MPNRLRASGEGGSRSLITRPIIRLVVGSTRSIARVPCGRPKKRRSCRGTIADHWPAATCDTRLKIEFVSTAGSGFAPTERNMPSMMRRFCMSGVSRQSGARGGFAPGNLRSVGEGRLRGRQEHVLLDADRLRLDPLDRLRVEVGQSHVEFEVLDPAFDLLAGQGENRDRHARKLRGERPREVRDDGQRCRNRADPEPAAQALVDLVEAAPQVVRLRQHAVGVLEDEFSLRRQADEAMAPLDDRRSEILFEQPYRRRKRRLGHMTGLAQRARNAFRAPAPPNIRAAAEPWRSSPPYSWRPVLSGSIVYAYRSRAAWRAGGDSTRRL